MKAAIALPLTGCTDTDRPGRLYMSTVLGSAAGARVWVTSRSQDKREQALELGAEQAFEPGERLPERVDAVMETVGAATFKHSIRSLRKPSAS